MSAEVSAQPGSKKETILDLYKAGTIDIAEIVRIARCRPSYAVEILQGEGLLKGYFDLYTQADREQNVYSKFFRGLLAYANVDEARASVERINRLHEYFERLGDREGQHQACVLALTGRNRARWSGKLEASAIFAEWLSAH